MSPLYGGPCYHNWLIGQKECLNGYFIDEVVEIRDDYL